MKRRAILVYTVFILLTTATKAWAEDQIVTIYFAGTSADFQWSSPHKTAWVNHEELLATLFAEHRVATPHHKWFVDGIGTGCSDIGAGIFGDLGDLLGSGFPGWDVCRGWNTNLADARGFLENIIDRFPGDEIILNLVGWSRGGAAAIRFASDTTANPELSNPRLKTINILAIDPVVGDLDEMWDTGHYTLDSKVANYVGLYARHERSHMFGPTLPAYNPSHTDAWMLQVPGSHETLVGNQQETGHHLILGCFVLGPDCVLGVFTGANSVDPDFYNVYWVTKVFTQQLLGDPAWGRVRFDWDWYKGAPAGWSRRNWFEHKLETIWFGIPWARYQYMQNFAFTPLGLEDVKNLFGDDWCGVPGATGQFNDRCTINYDGGSVNINTGLLANSSPISMWEWDQIEHNGAPVANAGADQTITLDSQPCPATITLDGSGSSDPDGDTLTYTWSGIFGELNGINVQAIVPLGIHTIWLDVEDEYGETSSDSVVVTVLDESPPVVSCNAPPTITEVDDRRVMFRATATDNCAVTSVDITQYEIWKLTKKGETVDKVANGLTEVAGDTITFQGLAGVGTRLGWTVVATDASANSSKKSCEVLVVNPGKGK
jgi:hypothetical protein